MQLLRFIPIQLTLVLILGILLGQTIDFGTTLPIILTLVLLMLLGIVFYVDAERKSYLFGGIALLLAMSLGILSISFSKSKNIANHYSQWETNKNQTWQLKITETLKPNAYAERYIAKVIAVDQKKAVGTLLFSRPVDSLKPPLRIDEELIVVSKLQEVGAPLNPHQFNYSAYLKRLGIDNQLRANSNIKRLENSSKTIYGSAANLRQQIISKLKKANFGEAELSIIQALVLGQRNDISATTYTNYKNAGAIHILAVSGLHIGILLLLLQWLLKPIELLPRGKTIKLILIVILLWGFALLAGFSASIVRAVSMFSFVAYALYLNRPSNTFNILALSMFFILLVIDPNLLFQVGFQMSYAAVFAIVWLYPLLQKLWLPKNKIIRKLWQLLAVSIAAQIGVLPISLFYFHQFPGLFFISNLVIVPALGLFLGIGLLVVVLAMLQVLPDWLVSIYDFLIRKMNQTISWVAQQEAFVFQNISFDAVQLVLAYVILFCSILFLSKPNFKKGMLAAFAILSFQAYVFYNEYNVHQKETLIAMHQTRNTILLQQSGDQLFVFAQDSSRINRLLTDYQIGEQISTLQKIKLQHSYQYKNKTILRIDSLGYVPPKLKHIDYLLLTQSPKINLDRVLDSVQPKKVIVDGSNYSSFVQRWARTCARRKLPFHYTGEKGAYVFE